jgi:hypothetical protein
MSVSFAAQSAERRKLSAEEDWPLGGAKIFHDAASTCETEAGLAGFGVLAINSRTPSAGIRR